MESARALHPTNQNSVSSTISWRWPGVIPKHKPRKKVLTPTTGPQTKPNRTKEEQRTLFSEAASSQLLLLPGKLVPQFGYSQTLSSDLWVKWNQGPTGLPPRTLSSNQFNSNSLRSSDPIFSPPAPQSLRKVHSLQEPLGSGLNLMKGMGAQEVGSPKFIHANLPDRAMSRESI